MINKNIELIVNTLNDKQAEDIRVIDIQDISTIADYFIIANSKNLQHLSAVSESVIEEMEKVGNVDKKIEGNYNSGWVLMDFGDIIIHIFDKENRVFYNLEKMWKDGKEVNVIDIIGGNDESQN